MSIQDFKNEVIEVKHIIYDFERPLSFLSITGWKSRIKLDIESQTYSLFDRQCIKRADTVESNFSPEAYSDWRKICSKYVTSAFLSDLIESLKLKININNQNYINTCIYEANNLINQVLIAKNKFPIFTNFLNIPSLNCQIFEENQTCFQEINNFSFWSDIEYTLKNCLHYLSPINDQFNKISETSIFSAFFKIIQLPELFCEKDQSLALCPDFTLSNMKLSTLEKRMASCSMNKLLSDTDKFDFFWKSKVDETIQRTKEVDITLSNIISVLQSEDKMKADTLLDNLKSQLFYIRSLWKDIDDKITKSVSLYYWDHRPLSNRLSLTEDVWGMSARPLIDFDKKVKVALGMFQSFDVEYIRILKIVGMEASNDLTSYLGKIGYPKETENKIADSRDLDLNFASLNSVFEKNYSPHLLSDLSSLGMFIRAIRLLVFSKNISKKANSLKISFDGAEWFDFPSSVYTFIRSFKVFLHSHIPAYEELLNHMITQRSQLNSLNINIHSYKANRIDDSRTNKLFNNENINESPRNIISFDFPTDDPSAFTKYISVNSNIIFNVEDSLSVLLSSARQNSIDFFASFSSLGKEALFYNYFNDNFVYSLLATSDLPLKEDINSDIFAFFQTFKSRSERNLEILKSIISSNEKCQNTFQNIDYLIFSPEPENQPFPTFDSEYNIQIEKQMDFFNKFLRNDECRISPQDEADCYLMTLSGLTENSRLSEALMRSNNKWTRIDPQQDHLNSNSIVLLISLLITFGVLAIAGIVVSIWLYRRHKQAKKKNSLSFLLQDDENKQIIQIQTFENHNLLED